MYVARRSKVLAQNIAGGDYLVSQGDEDLPPPARPSTGGDANELQPSKKRGKGWVVLLLLLTLILSGTHFAACQRGISIGAREERAAVAASASAAAAKSPPPQLYCPERDSKEFQEAITNQQIVVIAEPPTAKVVVVRKAVVVIVRAKITNDLVVCGNDAAVVLEYPLADSARVYIAGGQDIRPGVGPALFVVDNVTAPDEQRVWFSNHHPQIIRCYVLTVPAADRPRACSSYYVDAPPSPSLTPSRK